jgi:hypothetical protein
MRSRLSRGWTLVWAWMALGFCGYTKFTPSAEAAAPGVPTVAASLGQTIPWIETGT